ncbi:hypothetical protein BJ973_005095 [Actinoplanes tereljensis]|uniref:Uncharacterized protein n=1 Tax=Paractinoplanes tereljensis TaxID=571912 RepID=A0A919NMY2_9ACTN|nr:hypothetical protein [Actinoplanes tereljensis]GIF21458.1 hypothetical protein Ate02nite_41880 [Actinoplanes tereljensis]
MTGNWIPEVGVTPVPRGWQAVRRFDRETGEPVILMRVHPIRRWLTAAAAAAGVALLWCWFIWTREASGGFFVFGTLMATSGTIGTVVLTLTQDGFTVTPGRMRCGRVWVASGNWRGRVSDASDLELEAHETDNITKLHLYANHRGGGRDELFTDDETGRIARPFADWLSAVAHIPVNAGGAS